MRTLRPQHPSYVGKLGNSLLSVLWADDGTPAYLIEPPMLLGASPDTIWGLVKGTLAREWRDRSRRRRRLVRRWLKDARAVPCVRSNHESALYAIMTITRKHYIPAMIKSIWGDR